MNLPGSRPPQPTRTCGTPPRNKLPLTQPRNPDSLSSGAHYLREAAAPKAAGARSRRLCAWGFYAVCAAAHTKSAGFPGALAPKLTSLPPIFSPLSPNKPPDSVSASCATQCTRSPAPSRFAECALSPACFAAQKTSANRLSALRRRTRPTPAPTQPLTKDPPFSEWPGSHL